MERKSNYKLLQYLDLERNVQEKWEKERMFEENVSPKDNGSKYFVTFPYPYMNGKLHLGHSFTISKCEVSYLVL